MLCKEALAENVAIIMTVTAPPSTLDPATTSDMISTAPDTENVKVYNLILL